MYTTQLYKVKALIDPLIFTQIQLQLVKLIRTCQTGKTQTYRKFEKSCQDIIKFKQSCYSFKQNQKISYNYFFSQKIILLDNLCMKNCTYGLMNETLVYMFKRGEPGDNLNEESKQINEMQTYGLNDLHKNNNLQNQNGFQNQISTIEHQKSIQESSQNFPKKQTLKSNIIIEVDGQKREILQIKRSPKMIKKYNTPNSNNINYQSQNNNSFINNQINSNGFNPQSSYSYYDNWNNQNYNFNQSNVLNTYNNENNGRNNFFQQFQLDNSSQNTSIQAVNMFNQNNQTGLIHPNNFNQNQGFNNYQPVSKDHLPIITEEISPIRKNTQSPQQNNHSQIPIEIIYQKNHFKRDSSGTNLMKKNLYQVSKKYQISKDQQQESQQKQVLAKKKIQKRKKQLKRLFLGDDVSDDENNNNKNQIKIQIKERLQNSGNVGLRKQTVQTGFNQNNINFNIHNKQNYSNNQNNYNQSITNNVPCSNNFSLKQPSTTYSGKMFSNSPNSNLLNYLSSQPNNNGSLFYNSTELLQNYINQKQNIQKNGHSSNPCNSWINCPLSSQPNNIMSNDSINTTALNHDSIHNNSYHQSILLQKPKDPFQTSINNDNHSFMNNKNNTQVKSDLISLQNKQLDNLIKKYNLDSINSIKIQSNNQNNNGNQGTSGKSQSDINRLPVITINNRSAQLFQLQNNNNIKIDFKNNNELSSDFPSINICRTDSLLLNHDKSITLPQNQPHGQLNNRISHLNQANMSLGYSTVSQYKIFNPNQNQNNISSIYNANINITEPRFNQTNTTYQNEQRHANNNNINGQLRKKNKNDQFNYKNNQSESNQRLQKNQHQNNDQMQVNNNQTNIDKLYHKANHQQNEHKHDNKFNQYQNYNFFNRYKNVSNENSHIQTLNRSGMNPIIDHNINSSHNYRNPYTQLLPQQNQIIKLFKQYHAFNKNFKQNQQKSCCSPSLYHRQTGQLNHTQFNLYNRSTDNYRIDNLLTNNACTDTQRRCIFKTLNVRQRPQYQNDTYSQYNQNDKAADIILQQCIRQLNSLLRCKEEVMNKRQSKDNTNPSNLNKSSLNEANGSQRCKEKQNQQLKQKIDGKIDLNAIPNSAVNVNQNLNNCKPDSFSLSKNVQNQNKKQNDQTISIDIFNQIILQKLFSQINPLNRNHLNSSTTVQIFLKLLVHYHKELINQLIEQVQIFYGHQPFRHANYNYKHSNKTYYGSRSEDAFLPSQQQNPRESTGLIDKIQQISSGGVNYQMNQLYKNIYFQLYQTVQNIQLAKDYRKQNLYDSKGQLILPKKEELSTQQQFLYNFVQYCTRNANQICDDPLYKYYHYDQIIQNTIKCSLWLHPYQRNSQTNQNFPNKQSIQSLAHQNNLAQQKQIQRYSLKTLLQKLDSHLKKIQYKQIELQQPIQMIFYDLFGKDYKSSRQLIYLNQNYNFQVDKICESYETAEDKFQVYQNFKYSSSTNIHKDNFSFDNFGCYQQVAFNGRHIQFEILQKRNQQTYLTKSRNFAQYRQKYISNDSNPLPLFLKQIISQNSQIQKFIKDKQVDRCNQQKQQLKNQINKQENVRLNQKQPNIIHSALTNNQQIRELTNDKRLLTQNVIQKNKQYEIDQQLDTVPIYSTSFNAIKNTLIDIQFNLQYMNFVLSSLAQDQQMG